MSSGEKNSPARLKAEIFAAQIELHMLQKNIAEVAALIELLDEKKTLDDETEILQSIHGLLPNKRDVLLNTEMKMQRAKRETFEQFRMVKYHLNQLEANQRNAAFARKVTETRIAELRRARDIYRELNNCVKSRNERPRRKL